MSERANAVVDQFLEDQAMQFGADTDMQPAEDFEGELEGEDAGTELPPDALIQQLQENNEALRELVLSLKSAREPVGEAQPEGESAPTLPEGVSEENVAMFKALAEHLGYVPRSELEQRELEAQADTYATNAMRQAVEDFGENFGAVDAQGNVVVKPEVQQRLRSRFQALRDPKQGITLRDLFILEHAEDILAGKIAPPARREAAPQALRTPTRPKAPPVLRRSAAPGAVSATSLYDPKRGDSAEDVIDRSFALAKAQLRRGR
jgi:hypothetical protein